MKQSLQHRIRRQNALLLAVATALGIWLGTGAPGASPVAPPAAAAVAAPVAPVPPVQGFGGGPGRGRP